MPAVSAKKYHPMTLHADVWWALFVALGPTRSLPAVRKFGIQHELKTPSLQTLRNWSTRDNWQARAYEADARGKPADLTISDAVEEMNQRQATSARALLEVANRSIEKQKEDVVGLEKVPEMMATATRVERVAMGAATDRTEVSHAFVQTMAPRIVEIFIAVNILPDAESRATQFMEQMNELAGQFISG